MSASQALHQNSSDQVIWQRLLGCDDEGIFQDPGLLQQLLLGLKTCQGSLQAKAQHFNAQRPSYPGSVEAQVLLALTIQRESPANDKAAVGHTLCA